MKANCFKCGTILDYPQNTNIPRGDTCQKCHSSVRTCRNCKFYDQNRHNECSEPQADRIVDKEQANFCDYFSLNLGAKNTAEAKNKKESVLSELDKLFK